MDENFTSDFVLDIKGKLYQNFKNEYAYSEIEKFLKLQNLEYETFEIIEPKYHISYQDFRVTRENLMRDIYLGLLENIKKEDGKLIFNKKVCISFDERLCTQYCEIIKRRFTTINIGGKDVVYFIHFDIKEIFDYIYTKKTDIHYNNTVNEQEVKIPSVLDNPSNVEIKKIKGVVVNHNFERGDKNLTFILTSSNGDGLALHHNNFPAVSKLDIGTIVELKYVSSNERRYPEDYEILNEQEIPGLCEFFEGELFQPRNSNVGFIHHRDGTIFVPPHLLDDSYQANSSYNVRCLAIKRHRDREHKLEWEAEKIFRI